MTGCINCDELVGRVTYGVCFSMVHCRCGMCFMPKDFPSEPLPLRVPSFDERSLMSPIDKGHMKKSVDPMTRTLARFRTLFKHRDVQLETAVGRLEDVILHYERVTTEANLHRLATQISRLDHLATAFIERVMAEAHALETVRLALPEDMARHISTAVKDIGALAAKRDAEILRLREEVAHWRRVALGRVEQSFYEAWDLEGRAKNAKDHKGE
jgi:hypothetical protein